MVDPDDRMLILHATGLVRTDRLTYNSYGFGSL